MRECTHPVLVLCERTPNKLRCRHCHLTISPEELGGGPCPECKEALGVDRRDFEEVEGEQADKVRYRCEACGIMIEVS